MGPVYAFDPERFYLGKLCCYGHRWPGTDLSLRKRYVSPAGNVAPACVGCKGAKTKNWLLPFIDLKKSGVPDGMHLGKICKEGHNWKNTGYSLRDKWKKCPICEQARGRQAVKDGKLKEWYQRNAESERAKARERMARRLQDPVKREQQRESSRLCNARRRALEGRQCEAKGLKMIHLPPGSFFTPQEAVVARQLVEQGVEAIFEVLKPIAVQTVALRQSLFELEGRQVARTVAELVEAEQQRFFDENPDVLKKIRYKKQNRLHKEKMLFNSVYREQYLLYHRQKSKRRKAVLRGSIGHQLTGSQVRKRFEQFGHTCAYCGKGGELHIEHVVPISRDGTHVLGNIVPACPSCNFSKAAREVESWYRAQPFFCKKRWRKICRVLGIGKGSPNQLALL